MKKFEYLELHVYTDATGATSVELAENEFLKDYGFKCDRWSEDWTIEGCSNYNEQDYPSEIEVLNKLGQFGWEAFSIRPIQTWISNPPKKAKTNLEVVKLVSERQLSIWLKREILEKLTGLQ